MLFCFSQTVLFHETLIPSLFCLFYFVLFLRRWPNTQSIFGVPRSTQTKLKHADEIYFSVLMEALGIWHLILKVAYWTMQHTGQICPIASKTIHSYSQTNRFIMKNPIRFHKLCTSEGCASLYFLILQTADKWMKQRNTIAGMGERRSARRSEWNDWHPFSWFAVGNEKTLLKWIASFQSLSKCPYLSVCEISSCFSFSKGRTAFMPVCLNPSYCHICIHKGIWNRILAYDKYQSNIRVLVKCVFLIKSLICVSLFITASVLVLV